MQHNVLEIGRLTQLLLPRRIARGLGQCRLLRDVCGRDSSRGGAVHVQDS